MRFPDYSTLMPIRDSNSRMYKTGAMQILCGYSVNLRREFIDHNAGAYSRPPAINGDEPNTYHGYFANTHGEQFIFVFNTETKKSELWCGDAGWEQPYPVVDGSAEGLILSFEEQMWLVAAGRPLGGE